MVWSRFIKQWGLEPSDRAGYSAAVRLWRAENPAEAAEEDAWLTLALQAGDDEISICRLCHPVEA